MKRSVCCPQKSRKFCVDCTSWIYCNPIATTDQLKMPKTVLKMYIDEERKARERSAKEEIRGLLQARTDKLKEQAALREKETPLTAKEKRDLKKQKKLSEKNEALPCDTVTEAAEVQDFNIPGFRVVLEHLRRDAHCLLCPKLRVESSLQCEVDENSDAESCDTDSFDVEDENDSNTLDESASVDQAYAKFGQSHINSCKDDTRHVASRLQCNLVAEQSDDCLAANLLPIIACQDAIEHTDRVIRFTLDARNGQAQQAFVLTIPRLYFPDGLTKVFVDQKIRDAVERVSAEDEERLRSMSAITNKVSIGHQEGHQLRKELAAHNRAKALQSYLYQQAQMKAVIRDKEERKWKRILTTTGAAREKNQDIRALAERDVMIGRGELRGKYTMKSSKGLQDMAVDKTTSIEFFLL